MVAGELSGSSEWLLGSCQGALSGCWLLGSCQGVLSGCWGVVGEF